MAAESVLMLYNQPLLPKDHPDAESEHTVVEIADDMIKVLSEAGYRMSKLGLGTDPTVLWNELQKQKPDVVFNLFEGNLHNTETETIVAGLLDWAGVAYTGSPAATLSLAHSKHVAKGLLKGAGLPTADFVVVNELPIAECSLEFPVIVKPAEQDGSVGMDQESVCIDAFHLEQRVQYILRTYGPPVIIEEFIEGREFNVALVELPELQALPPAEIIFPEDRPGVWSILTYDGKWTPGTPEYETSPPKYPADLPTATARKLGRLAMKVFRLFSCRDYARVDFRMNPAGKVYVLEINPNPEISDAAGFAGCLGSAKFSYRDFLVRLVEQALSRRDLPKPTFVPSRPTTSLPSDS